MSWFLRELGHYPKRIWIKLSIICSVFIGSCRCCAYGNECSMRSIRPWVLDLASRRWLLLLLWLTVDLKTRPALRDTGLVR